MLVWLQRKEPQIALGRMGRPVLHEPSGTCNPAFAACQVPDDAGVCSHAMDLPQARDPLHGVTLEKMLNELVADFGWPELGRRIAIRCFTSDPSIASSLEFLRKTPWARAKVEGLYGFMLREWKRDARR